MNETAGYRLGIDFGTSNTVAVLVAPTGRHSVLLFDGSPTLPSAVCLDPAGHFLTGRTPCTRRGSTRRASNRTPSGTSTTAWCCSAPPRCRWPN